VSDCCTPKGYRQIFSEKNAAGEAKRYRRKGVDGTSKRIFDFIRERGVEGKLVMSFPNRRWWLVLGMGEVQLAGKVPSGHWATLTPRRMYLVPSARAELAGLDLGSPVKATEPPTIGAMRLPSKPAFAVGRAFFKPR
jgi:hypothetical protein